MFVHKEFRLKKLSGDIMPSGRALYERYGSSEPKGHPDNTDPYHFTTPVNEHVGLLEKLNSVRVRVRSDYAATLQELAAQEIGAAQAEPAPEADTKTAKESKTTPKDE